MLGLPWLLFVAASDGRGSAAAAGRRHVLIMDEVDGMAGNEDRGGVQVSWSLVYSTLLDRSVVCRS